MGNLLKKILLVFLSYGLGEMGFHLAIHSLSDVKFLSRYYALFWVVSQEPRSYMHIHVSSLLISMILLITNFVTSWRRRSGILFPATTVLFWVFMLIVAFQKLPIVNNISLKPDVDHQAELEVLELYSLVEFSLQFLSVISGILDSYYYTSSTININAKIEKNVKIN
jgi:hypothetical protein